MARKIEIREVATKLGLGVSATRNLTKNNTFPPAYIYNARTMRWDEESVDQWIESRRNCPSYKLGHIIRNSAQGKGDAIFLNPSLRRKAE
jgi:predicted DNA-binding transcriptional regulator AlpA